MRVAKLQYSLLLISNMRLCIANKRIVRMVYLACGLAPWLMVAREFPCAALTRCVSLRRGKFKPDFKICLYTLYREPRDPAYSLAHTKKSASEVQLGGKGID